MSSELPSFGRKLERYGRNTHDAGLEAYGRALSEQGRVLQAMGAPAYLASERRIELDGETKGFSPDTQSVLEASGQLVLPLRGRTIEYFSSFAGVEKLAPGLYPGDPEYTKPAAVTQVAFYLEKPVLPETFNQPPKKIQEVVRQHGRVMSKNIPGAVTHMAGLQDMMEFLAAYQEFTGRVMFYDDNGESPRILTSTRSRRGRYYTIATTNEPYGFSVQDVYLNNDPLTKDELMDYRAPVVALPLLYPKPGYKDPQPKPAFSGFVED